MPLSVPCPSRPVRAELCAATLVCGACLSSWPSGAIESAPVSLGASAEQCQVHSVGERTRSRIYQVQAIA